MDEFSAPVAGIGCANMQALDMCMGAGRGRPKTPCADWRAKGTERHLPFGGVPHALVRAHDHTTANQRGGKAKATGQPD